MTGRLVWIFFVSLVQDTLSRMTGRLVWIFFVSSVCIYIVELGYDVMKET
jgi:preprotein translocase subunit SecG